MRNPQLKIATEAEAKSMDQEVIRLIAEVRSGWFRLGLLIDRMQRTHAFDVLGFSMHSWMQARLGESSATAYSALRSVRALEGVPAEKLEQIGERNAHALTYLLEQERKSEEWLKKAATLPTKDFKREVETAIQKKTGLAREKLKPFVILLPELVYDSLCEAEKKVARSLSIDIESNPNSRILVWEAFSQWILLTDVETIRIQTEGIPEGGEET